MNTTLTNINYTKLYLTQELEATVESGYGLEVDTSIKIDYSKTYKQQETAINKQINKIIEEIKAANNVLSVSKNYSQAPSGYHTKLITLMTNEETITLHYRMYLVDGDNYYRNKFSKLIKQYNGITKHEANGVEYLDTLKRGIVRQIDEVYCDAFE